MAYFTRDHELSDEWHPHILGQCSWTSVLLATFSCALVRQILLSIALCEHISPINDRVARRQPVPSWEVKAYVRVHVFEPVSLKIQRRVPRMYLNTLREMKLY